MAAAAAVSLAAGSSIAVNAAMHNTMGPAAPEAPTTTAATASAAPNTATTSTAPESTVRGGITEELPDCPEIADKDIPQYVKCAVNDLMDSFPTRNDARKGGWCLTYKKGPNQGQPLPTLTSFIFSLADPTTHKWGELID
jgi:hypothetical protein